MYFVYGFIYLFCPCVLYDIAVTRPFGCQVCPCLFLQVIFCLFTMAEQRRRNFQDGQAGPSRDDDGMSSSSDDDCDVAGPSHTQEPDDAFCTAVVQKILPALVQALGSEKVRETPTYPDSDSSDVDMDSVPLDGSHAPVSGVSSPVGLSAVQAAPQVNATTSRSSAEDFLGFPVVNDQHVPVVQSLGAAFDVDDANGPPVSEAFAKTVRPFLRMVPDDKKARLLADQWSIPCNLKELKTPESDATVLSTLDHQSRRMESKLAQTNSLLGKALIPLIRILDKHGNSQDSSMLDSCKDINASVNMLLPVFNYLNLMRRDIITDVLKAKSLQRTVKDKNMTGDKLFESNIVDMVKQFKESQRHIHPKKFKLKRNNPNFALFRKGSTGRGFGLNHYRGSQRGRGGRGRGQFGNK